jgi:predicted membrane protein
MAKRKRALLSTVVLLIVVGSVGFVNLSGKDRFKAYWTVDVVQLLATGMCYGVALAGIFSLIRKADPD